MPDRRLWKRLRILNPILYQGARRKGNYFEGWYFKQTAWGPMMGRNDRGPRALVFIPGISRSERGDHAFIQTMDGGTGSTRYFTFPATAFSTSDDPFEIRIGDNRFSLTGINVDLEDEEGRIGATIRYGPITPPRRSPLKPGVMGPYSFAPLMECYHGVASLDHPTEGFAWINDKDVAGPPAPIIFNGGRGYIEKDWGSSMPEAWLWIQANDFDPSVASAAFTFSLGRVPWRGGAFNGLICILWIAGKEYRFATYTGARIDLLEVRGESLRILLSDRKYKMEIQVRLSHEGILVAPAKGSMNRRIAESLDSWTRILLKRRHGASDELVFDAASPAAGVELVGDPNSLKS